jgi:hypothetical protein
VITFVADVHVDNFAKWGGPMRAGLNDRARAVLATLETAVATSIANGGDDAVLVILGDLFNRARPEPALIYAVQQILDQHPNPIALVGNHDQESTAYGHNALAPLYGSASVIETPQVYSRDSSACLWLVPFQPGPILEWLPGVLLELEGDLDLGALVGEPPQPRALCLHAGISDSGTPYYLDETAGSINVDALEQLMLTYDIDCVFAGDWHRHQRWDLPATPRNRTERNDPRVIMQVGSLAPSRFPPNYEHGDRGPLAIWRPSIGEVEVQDVAGPRFWKARWSNLDKSLLIAQGDPAYVKLTCRSDQADEAREWLDALKVNAGLCDANRIGGTELEVDRGIERAKARTASFEARQASSLDEAIARYVQAMPVEKGVERDRVLTHVRRLLG